MRKYRGLSGKEEKRLNMLIGIACEYFNVEEDVLLSKSRKRPLPDIRFIILVLAVKYVKNNISQIGKAVRGFHHTTVLHARTVVEDMLTIKDPFYTENLHEIEDMFLKKLNPISEIKITCPSCDGAGGKCTVCNGSKMIPISSTMNPVISKYKKAVEQAISELGVSRDVALKVLESIVNK